MRDPFREIARLQQEFDEFVERMFRRGPLFVAGYSPAWIPRADVYELDDRVVVLVELAGVEAGDVQATVEGRTLRLTGSRSEVVKEAEGCAEGRCHQLEIPFGPFEKEIALPADVDGERASGRFERGMLVIILPKRKGPAFHHVPVKQG